MTDHSDLIARLRHADQHSQQRVWGSRIFDEAASALSSQSLSLSEAREEIERLKGLVAGIRECPQEPVDLVDLIDQLRLRASRKCVDGYAIPFDSNLDIAAADALEKRIGIDTSERNLLKAALQPFADAFDNAVISGRPPFEFVGAKEFELASKAVQS